jgi:hypothetical protein
MPARALLRSLSLVALGLAGGCATPCEAQFDRTFTQFRDCDLVIETPPDLDSTCDTERTKLLRCEADCAEDAPCSALDGTSADDSIAYASCLSRCLAALEAEREAE